MPVRNLMNIRLFLSSITYRIVMFKYFFRENLIFKFQSIPNSNVVCDQFFFFFPQVIREVLTQIFFKCSWFDQFFGPSAKSELVSITESSFGKLEIGVALAVQFGFKSHHNTITDAVFTYVPHSRLQIYFVIE